MKQKYFHVFEDNIIVEFNLNTDTRKMELYLEDYWDKEKRETVSFPCCFTIFAWEEATWIEKGIHNYVSTMLPLTNTFSPLTDIYDMDLKDDVLIIEGRQENGMYPTLYFKNCQWSFSHVDMSSHVNMFQTDAPESILKRDCSGRIIPKVTNKKELLFFMDKILKVPPRYGLTWENLEENLYGRDFSGCNVMLLYHEDISQMPIEDLRQYADLINRCNRNNNHCYFIFNEHDYQLMMRLVNNSHD